MEIVWNLPSEGADLDRASELEMCLECFPESPLVEAWTHELEKICSLAEKYRIHLPEVKGELNLIFSDNQ